MKYKAKYCKKTLHFLQPAGTSRGVYTERNIWIVRLEDFYDSSRFGIGECAPLPHLSCDDLPEYEEVFNDAINIVCHSGRTDFDELRPYPSIVFGLETAIRHCERGTLRLFDTPFARGEEAIPINGLIWMGSFEEMNKRIDEKLKAGFKCIKLKIGAIDFDSELALLQKIRNRYSKEAIELRVDANGAFSPDEAMKCLEALAELDIHSIEQPIMARQWDEMARLCRNTPLPIALDEELIGIRFAKDKAELLDYIKPQFIILKPSLHGGMAGTREWVELSRKRNIGSWITSALESNIGLNAIAHLAADIYGPEINMFQGLGTGSLFADNIDLKEYKIGIDCGKLLIK